MRPTLRFVFLLCAGLTGGALAAEPVRIGVLSYSGGESALAGFEASAVHLRAALPERDIELLPLTLPELGRAAAAGAIDFAFTNPGDSFQMARRYGASRLATARYPGLGNHEGVLGALIVTRADGPVTALDDLVGRRLGIVDPAAFGGHLVARQRLLRALGGAVDRIETVTLGFPHQRVLEAVESGAVDAGVVRACLFESLAEDGRLDPDRFRPIGLVETGGLPCLASTPMYPGWAFLMLPHVAPELATEVTRALLSMPRAGSADPLHFDGWVVPLGYASVEQLYRELALFPFEPDLAAGVRAWLRDNTHWVALAAILIGAFLLHVARVEYLVVRRTRALERAEVERRALETEMARTERHSAMAMMAGSLAHDLNQPLAAIASFAGGLRQRRRAGTDDPATTDRVLERIVEQADRAADFIRSMRRFFSAGEAEEEPVDLRAVVDDAVMLTSAHARHREIALDWTQPSFSASSLGDPVRLRQVVVTLVQNAVEASKPGAVVEIALRPGDLGWQIMVADRGCGIADELREKVFEPFFTTKGGAGMGLGLATARAIVEERGGRLRLDPRPGGGTIARVDLPNEVAG
ncbi:sensor histidine kinase [Maritimibacter sp. HL-12]|uniref:sensor histidine kinase n=1 Tax=Maritimibacter sp. HL-12 TaxID=1162418 RepID=UPI000A0F0658|nr:sensor histidine kinase [Maritimibacter sp. HL-12]SMH31683.1 two-component system, LuxR family, sensor histidine kinase TtrS [Maritimibacter sp. HL-12]